MKINIVISVSTTPSGPNSFRPFLMFIRRKDYDKELKKLFKYKATSGTHNATIKSFDIHDDKEVNFILLGQGPEGVEVEPAISIIIGNKTVKYPLDKKTISKKGNIAFSKKLTKFI